MVENLDQIFRLPDLGEGLQDAEIVAWHVAEGDHVAADQPLVSVETDKAVVEIPSPHSGRIAKLLGTVHERLTIGAPLVAFADDDGADPGSVVGALETEAEEMRPLPTEPRSPSPQPPAAREGGGFVANAPNPRPRAAPAVRALAAQMGVDLATIAGTGPDGEVTRDDVRHHAAPPPPSWPSPTRPSQVNETPTPALEGAVSLRGVRRAMALRMAEAGAAIVPATVTDEADIESWPPDTSIMVRLIAAIVAGCRSEPALNAAFDGGQVARRMNDAVHVGIAVDTEDGLLVPVLRDAHTLGSDGIQFALDALKTAARTRRATPDTLRGATISLSNFGPIGGLHAALVVVPPQVAILGAGRVVTRVLVEGLGVTEHRTLPLSLTFDHRAVSGGEAARFLAAVKASLETASLP